MTSPIILHGVEIKFGADLVTPIAVGDTSVVGLVGTAANAAAARAASLTLGSDNSAITYTADATGPGGNGISVRLHAAAASQALAVSVSGLAITIALATAASGAATSTAAQVVAAITASADASALISATAGGDGSGVVRPAQTVYLVGGRNEPFPVNTPVIINNSAAIALLGDSGTLVDAVEDVWRSSGRYGATIVAVRVADGVDAAATLANVIGDKTAKTGVYALLDAEIETGRKPRIIAAPGYTDNLAAGLALQAAGDDIGALAIVDAAGATVATAVADAAPYNNAYVVWPSLTVNDAAVAANVNRPASGLIAGHLTRVDADEGWHNSPSNRQLSNVLGLEYPVDFEIDNPNSSANLLNKEFVTTVVRRDGRLYVWGNRLANGRLITHYRVERIISSAVAEYIADWVDRNVDLPFLDFILRKMNGFLRDQTARGILTGGRAFFDPAKNSVESLASNRVTFSIELGISNVAEHIIIEQSIVDVYNQQIIDAAAALVSEA